MDDDAGEDDDDELDEYPVAWPQLCEAAERLLARERSQGPRPRSVTLDHPDQDRLTGEPPADAVLYQRLTRRSGA